ncbi:MAG: DUF2845 domain-containing protein [Pseudomonadales bacterium]
MLGKTSYALMILAVLTLWTETAQANSMRCGQHIVSSGGRTGPTMYEVLKKCGEPAERAGFVWIYEKNGRIRKLSFDSRGLLVNIRAG